MSSQAGGGSESGSQAPVAATPEPEPELDLAAAAAGVPAERVMVPGRAGTKLFYTSKERLFEHTMSEQSRALRNATIERYNQRADFLGVYKPDFNHSTDIPGGDLKFTPKNAHQLLSNTLGASKAADHKAVRASTLHCGQSPWEKKTTVFAFGKPDTTSGWNLECTVDRKLQAQRIAELTEKSAVNTVRKQLTLLSRYHTQPVAQFKLNHEAQRQAKVDMFEQRKKDFREPNTGDIQVPARPRATLEDIMAVEALSYGDADNEEEEDLQAKRSAFANSRKTTASTTGGSRRRSRQSGGSAASASAPLNLADAGGTRTASAGKPRSRLATPSAAPEAQ